MIQLDRRGKDRLAWIGALLAPLAAVQIARQLGSPGPAAAAAAPAQTSTNAPEAPPGRVDPEPTPASPAQRRAAAWAESHGPTGDLRSPMDHADGAVVKTAEPAAAPAGPDPDPRDDQPELTLSAVMGGEGGSLAAINSHVYRMGDEPAPGWKIAEIDVRERTVTIRHTDGRTMKLTAR